MNDQEDNSEYEELQPERLKMKTSVGVQQKLKTEVTNNTNKNTNPVTVSSVQSGNNKFSSVIPPQNQFATYQATSRSALLSNGEESFEKEGDEKEDEKSSISESTGQEDVGNCVWLNFVVCSEDEGLGLKCLPR